jgi:starvation-inducible outer membrane lipoprotein
MGFMLFRTALAPAFALLFTACASAPAQAPSAF